MFAVAIAARSSDDVTAVADDHAETVGGERMPRPVFCGPFAPCTDIIVRDIGDGLVLPLGVDGEICIRTPSMFTAYWNAPSAAADASRDGWFHTGDIGQLDENGFLRFLGRTKGGSRSTA